MGIAFRGASYTATQFWELQIYGRWRSGARPRVSPKIALLSWNAQAEKLEMALGRALVN
jgi:hypothetical protein